VAHSLGSASLLDTVRTAFVHGMDIMLWTCGGIALGCAILALGVLGRRAGAGAVRNDPARDNTAQAGGQAGSVPVI
jgi:MFS transporter, DHA2 family, multidrug resistance protein